MLPLHPIADVSAFLLKTTESGGRRGQNCKLAYVVYNPVGLWCFSVTSWCFFFEQQCLIGVRHFCFCLSWHLTLPLSLSSLWCFCKNHGVTSNTHYFCESDISFFSLRYGGLVRRSCSFSTGMQVQRNACYGSTTDVSAGSSEEQ